MSQETLLGPYLKPGTPIKVGSYSTKIIRYLSEGGFSHVYIARLDIPVKGSDVAVLKRIVAPDKPALAAIRTEVETMKKLKGHRYIVTYIDSHASALSTGGFEVYVLMEYCPGGGLIDFMNTRLQSRLAEWEVLKIISDTTEAVACMHYLRPPLLHRDLKIENVLISGNGDYKLCDFGSCTVPKAAATTTQERLALEEDIQKNTTIQYRSPEMVDVSRRLPIDEKSDIWALGVLLYKLCYFTTPFEAQGQLAILNAAYTFPPYPPYTDRTKRLIAVTLQENPRDRPNIYQLLAEICAMRNVPVPIPDIYTKHRDSNAGNTSRSSSRPASGRKSEDILTYEAAAAAAAPVPQNVMPNVDLPPMRRGRPGKISSPEEVSAAEETYHRSQSRPRVTDNEHVVADSEFSTKFPSLEEMDQSVATESQAPSVDITERSRIEKLPQSVASAQKRDIAPRPNPDGQPTGRASQFPHPLPCTPDSQGQPFANLDLARVSAGEATTGNNVKRTQNSVSQALRNSAFALKNTDQANEDYRIPSTSLTPVIRPKPVFTSNEKSPQMQDRANQVSRSQLSDSLLTERLQARPQMVSRASQTSPKPNQAVQTQTSPPKMAKPTYTSTADPMLSSNLTRDSSGLVIPRTAYTKQSSPPQNQYKFSTVLDRPNESMKVQVDIERSKSATGARPKTIHIDSSINVLRDIDSPMTGTSRSDTLGPNHTGSSLVSDSSARPFHSGPPAIDSEYRSAPNATGLRRSVSVSASNRHHKRPSMSHIPSFSGAAKNLMSGKFGDAFKKFEASAKGKSSTPAVEQSNPLQVAENDLPEHITQHLHTTEARRSSSYSRTRPSLDLARINSETNRTTNERPDSVESTSTSMKEAMRKLKEKASQTYVPAQRTAQGYGKYTEPETLHRAAAVVPYARAPSAEKIVQSSKSSRWSGKHPQRYALPEDEDESKFHSRFPPLGDDFKV